MKMVLSAGVFTLAFAMNVAAFAADMATLTVTGQVASLTCSTGIVAGKPQQLCEDHSYVIDTKKVYNVFPGVITEMINVAEGTTRKIIVSSYD
ncbi:DUF2574 family protein [Klebsiella spallanzanii]|uniref:DUF2574 family protein n=1 Tax=Klebsiella spallanzanii TaxID=2587528 RepID=UPI00117148D4|nr:DUF2574 family protein [Klebsiella spallanzanii]VUS72219.1 hypothetical protein SB6419_04085 [Klebsiella spallanzanii]